VQRSIASFRGQSSFVTWTYRILITLLRTRRSRLRQKEVANDDSKESRAMKPRAWERILLFAWRWSGARQAHAHQRDVFLLYEVEGSAMRRSPDAGDDRNGLEDTLFQARRIFA